MATPKDVIESSNSEPKVKAIEVTACDLKEGTSPNSSLI
jgi:hypothetical protein